MNKATHTQSTIGNGRTANGSHPLIAVSDLPETELPTVRIPENQFPLVAKHGARRARDSPGSIENHERGALGEYGAAKFLGTPERFDNAIYEYGDPGYDFEISGWKIDVKTANPRFQKPSLMVDANKELTADFYVLVHQLAQRCYRVIGYASAAMVAQASPRTIRPHPATEVRVVEQDRLFPLPSSVSGIFG